MALIEDMFFEDMFQGNLAVGLGALFPASSGGTAVPPYSPFASDPRGRASAFRGLAPSFSAAERRRRAAS